MKLHDDSFDLLPVPDRRIWLRVAALGAATGALAGGIEAVGLALTMTLPMSAGESLQLGVATVGLDALLGFGSGVAGGVVAQVVRTHRWKRYRLGFTVASVLLAFFFLAPLARTLYRQDRPPAAVGMLALTAILGALAWYNSGYWFRRQLIGGAPTAGWRLLGWTGGVGLALLAVVVRGPAGPDLQRPPPSSPNVILVTIDTLRRDHLGLYGSALHTPVIDALGRAGVVFEDAVTPFPETLPSHTSMLTGLQPSQHDVLSNGMPLRGGFVTVAETLALSGYRTGAFVSSFAVDGATGIDQGFQVYDDDFFPALRGVGQVRAAATALPLLMRFGDPSDFPFLLERGSPETIRRALGWAGQPSDRPFFLWVHLFDPHSPYERHDGRPNPVDHRAILKLEPGYPYTDEERQQLRALYDHEVEYTDQMVDTLLIGLRERKLLDDTLVVFTADHGEALGEHGIDFTHHGIYEDVLAVPLILWSSDGRAVPGTRVPAMVNVADIANTLLEYTGLPLLSRTGSVPLLSYVRGDDVKPGPIGLRGRAGASLTAGQLCGVRDPSKLKYIRGQEGKEEAYDLNLDPGETTDIAADQPGLVERGRTNVATCLGQTVTGSGADDTTQLQLKALGYAE